jgi:hypothetical protein
MLTLYRSDLNGRAGMPTKNGSFQYVSDRQTIGR